MIRIFLPIVIVLASVVGSGEVIYACVKNGDGSVRIVAAGTSCAADETAVEWGIVGLRGPKGDTGPKGATGPQGLKGDTGPKGATGSQGPKGDAGLQGSKGATGSQGPKGATGPQGPKGDAGPQGSSGAPGSQGPKGDAGAPGPKGDAGPSGAAGPPGIGDIGCASNQLAIWNDTTNAWTCSEHSGLEKAAGEGGIVDLFVSAGVGAAHLMQFGSTNTIQYDGQPLARWVALIADNLANGLLIATDDEKPILFGANGKERMRVAGDGRVYMGTTYPFSYTLHVDGEDVWGGIHVESDVNTGIFVGKAGNVNATGGFPNQKNGVEVYAAEDNGIMVNYADEEGMWVYDVKEHGVLVTSAMEDGIHVKCPGATSRPGAPGGWTPSQTVCIGDAFEAEYGYVNLATREEEPPPSHCVTSQDLGRMIVQSGDVLWVCMNNGWVPIWP